MSEIVLKEFEGKELRTQIDDKGQAWFVAKDVCECLGLTYISKAIKGVDDRGKGMISIHTLGGQQEVLAVTKSGLYELTSQSRKPVGKKFRSWVNYEILPSIEKSGQYSIGQDSMDLELMNDPDVKMMREMVQNTIHRKKQELINQQLKIENAVLKSKIDNVDNTVHQLLRHRKGNDPIPKGMITLKKLRSKYFNGVNEAIVSEFLSAISHKSEPYTYVVNGVEYPTFCYLEEGLANISRAFFSSLEFVNDMPKNIRVQHEMIDGTFWLSKETTPIYIQDQLLIQGEINGL